MAADDYDVAVVGGGLVGVATAWGLAREGCRVVVLDEGDRAVRASRGNFALVWVQSKGLGLVLAHIVIVLPFALRLTLASAVGLDRSIEHAAISLGASDGTVLRRITLPLVLPGLISGWALAFINSFDEVTMTVFIAAPGTETLPVRMFLYIQDNIDPLVTSVSASVIAITVVALVGLDRLYGLDRLLTGENRGER